MTDKSFYLDWTYRMGVFTLLLKIVNINDIFISLAGIMTLLLAFAYLYYAILKPQIEKTKKLNQMDFPKL